MGKPCNIRTKLLIKAAIAAPEILGVAVLGGLIYLGTAAGGSAKPGYIIGNEPIYTSQAQYDRAHPTTSAKDGNGRVEARKKPVTEEKAQNLEKNANVPKTQLGPSGKPKINTVNKPTMKRARDAARNNSKSNSSSEKHVDNAGQPGHFHATRDGEKLEGKDNTHYAYPSPVNPPKAKD